MSTENLQNLFKKVMPSVDFCGIRYHRDHEDSVDVRQDVLQPTGNHSNQGVMITIHHNGGIGYSSTADLSEIGLRSAIDQAKTWAEKTAGKSVFDFSSIKMPAPTGTYQSTVKIPWNSISLKEKIDRLMGISKSLKNHESIVDWDASLWNISEYRLYMTNHGGCTEQEFSYLIPQMSVSANSGTETVTRSFSGGGQCNQGGLELLETANFDRVGLKLSEEAVELLSAPNCPSGKMDLLLAPDQMMLQIHESIGHPLELDRILGDERNYAGTSFVTMDMFGSYQYGSELLNITFDPTIPDQLASFAFDDEGSTAEKTFVIEGGVLKTPLGGAVSQARAGGVAGVANSRAVSWTRPAIDRMANLNLEAGKSSLEEMISSIENGVYMKTNSSWSIDDSRNKFQFGCEWGQKIENGELKGLVKKPNYRGISANFWRNLRMTGKQETVEVLGTPYCGKGEPNQAVKVGHASPACVFSDIDVFGGD